jgi:transposase
MDYFAGLDISVKETRSQLWIMRAKIVREARVASEPEALLQVLTGTLYHFKRVGLEAGCYHSVLTASSPQAGLPVINLC